MIVSTSIMFVKPTARGFGEVSQKIGKPNKIDILR